MATLGVGQLDTVPDGEGTGPAREVGLVGHSRSACQQTRRVRSRGCRAPVLGSVPWPTSSLPCHRRGPPCHRRGRPISSSARCSTGSARSTGCPNPRRPRSCAARWCTPRSSSSTACPPVTGSRIPRWRWWIPHGSGSSPTTPTWWTGWHQISARRCWPRRAPLLAGYYRLEDPTRFDPQSCEQRIEVELADGTLLRVSSTASTSRAPASCGWSTTRPAAPRRGPPALAEYRRCSR